MNLVGRRIGLSSLLVKDPDEELGVVASFSVEMDENMPERIALPSTPAERLNLTTSRIFRAENYHSQEP